MLWSIKRAMSALDGWQCMHSEVLEADHELHKLIQFIENFPQADKTYWFFGWLRQEVVRPRLKQRILPGNALQFFFKKPKTSAFIVMSVFLF